ncbi:MAG: hypothetical protein NZ952_03210 [Candidatus Bathyarchaeota archaeon]|nr:hypothetical protein [Candidatus Bathyarchaeota archaeon]
MVKSVGLTLYEQNLTERYSYIGKLFFYVVEARMNRLKITINTGRTIEQGCAKEHGKFSNEYLYSVAFCEMNPKDMEKLGLNEDDNVKVTTDRGSVVLRVKRSQLACPEGTVFIPYSPWANIILGSDTDATGMPMLKGAEAVVEPTREKVRSLLDLLSHIGESCIR